ncbi:MAG: thioredoxin family protein [Calditrichaceae bacterium]|nr:thioredoxin family protein [Calditrichaceae bacterium]
MKHIILNVVVFIFFSLMLIQAAELDKRAPDFTLQDYNGKTYKLSDFKGKYVVLEWINFGCPFVQKHYNSGNMQTLQKKYTENGVIWLSICSSAEGKQGYYTAKELANIAKEQGVNSTAYLIDESGEVGKLYDAKTTPHMYIINPKGNLIYAGAIDDVRSTNVEDVKTAKNYVSSVLNDCLAGKMVESAATTPYGCSVKYK